MVDPIIDNTDLSDNSQPAWTMLIGGDVVARNRFESKKISTGKHVSADLQSEVMRADLSVVNLEGPVNTDSPPIQKSGPNILLDEYTPSALRKIGFDIVTLANNHIMDYGYNGLRTTINECDRQGLRFCGAGESFEDAVEPLIFEAKDGTSVGIINICEKEFGTAGVNTPGSAWISHAKTLLKVSQTVSNVDTVVVIAHGGVENIPVPPIQRQQQLRRFVDVGADLVVGHHPHVPQGWEQYDGGMIFYSLGNFLFDRDTSSERHEKERIGLAIKINFNQTKIQSVRLLPIENSGGQICHLKNERNRTKHLEYLFSLTDIVTQQTELEKYWQQIAVDRFIKYYGRHLQGKTSGGRLGNLRYPVTRRHRWNPDCRGDEMLWLLNFFRNESKRWLVTTALATLTGKIEDKRSPNVRRDAQRLLDRTLPMRFEFLKEHF